MNTRHDDCSSNWWRYAYIVAISHMEISSSMFEVTKRAILSSEQQDRVEAFVEVWDALPTPTPTAYCTGSNDIYITISRLWFSHVIFLLLDAGSMAFDQFSFYKGRLDKYL